MSSSNVSFYVSAFDKDGRRISSQICPSKDEKKRELISNMKADMPDAEFVEVITADDFRQYLNGYVRGKDGKPTPYVVPEPSEVEKEKERADEISAKYKEEIEDLQATMATALLAGDDELIESIKEDYRTLMDSYQTEMKGDKK